MNNVRAQAAIIVAQVIKQHISLSQLLPSFKAEAKNAALLQELCFGTLRWYFRLNWLAKQFLQKPFKSQDQDIEALLLIGLYQLLFMRISTHAAVSETVEAVRELKKPWANKVINAILRRFLREQSQWQASFSQNLEADYAHPAWLVENIKNSWPNDWETILNNNNQQPPLTLRVNLSKITRADYLQRLQSLNIAATATQFSDAGVQLTAPQTVTSLPGFADGLISVQDEAAQLAAALLQLQPRLRVLDACAAPGGKTMHILESQTALTELIAIDNDQQRLNKINENLRRIQQSATLICDDAENINQWWDGKLFDRILLDAPCSATGVIRRHPDIKLLRRETDIKNLAATQLKLLQTLWTTLKSGGVLVYATCSILPTENCEVVSNFLTQQTDAQEIKINSTWGHEQIAGKQIFSGENNMDGFYYAVLGKT